MKKFTALICSLLILLCSFAVGCAKENPLYSAVSELRNQLFEGSGENFTVKACYGFKETPYSSDGLVGEKVYALSFRLMDKETDTTTYSISFEYDGKTYKSDFRLNAITNTVTAMVEIENFSLKELPITISYAGNNENITLKSIVPSQTISYKTALDHLKENQAELIKVYSDKSGNFNAEICARIIVKNNKPYWYIGISSNERNHKALLIDGINGKTLAIREVF